MIVPEDDDISVLTGLADTLDLDDDQNKTNAGGGSPGDGEEKQLPREEEDSDDEQLNKMEIDGFECPEPLLSKILPMEFEEMVNLFKTYDANGR